MIRVFYCSLLIFLTQTFKVTAQTIVFSNSTVYVTLTSDSNSAYLDFSGNTIISNTQAVVFSGKVYSEESILITPNGANPIVIKPVPVCVTCMPPPNEPNADPPGTVLKPKPGGTGRLYAPNVILYPVPVQSVLNFDVNNYLVNAYTVLDLNGVVKISQSIQPTHTGSVDVSALISGNYIIKLQIGTNQFTNVQFIKN